MPTPLRVFCLFLSTTLTAWAGPTAIFDGRSLAGWEGDTATWRVVDGCIEAGSLEELQHEAREALIQRFGPAHVTYRVRMRRAANQIQPLQRSLSQPHQSRR